MEQFGLIIIGSIVLETTVEIAKGFVKEDKKPNITQICTAILGVLVCFAYKLDVFSTLGMTSQIPYFGTICTGICISKGSNIFYDLVEKLIEKV